MSTKRLTIYFLILFIGFSAVQVIAQKATVTVFPDLKQQKIQSIGGNYCQANYSDHAWDAIGEETLKQFRPAYVRVALPLKLKKTDFSAYRGKNYIKQPLVIGVLESLKRMKEEFGVKNFTISVWDVPDELISDPAKSAQRVIKPEAYDEVITMLIDFLLKAKNDYGVEVDQFSFNESDGGYQIIFSPEATIAFIKQAGKRMDEAGLKTKFLWADTAQTKGTVEFATQIMADPSIRKYLGPLCFHSWWSEKIPDQEFERVAGLGKAWNKEVWCSELGFDAISWKIKDMNKSWDYGLRFAKIAHRMMKYAQIEVSLYWTWQNNYAIMSADLQQKYPSYYVTRHQTDFLNSGTQIVQSSSSEPEILSLSGIHPDGSKIIQLINLKKVPVTVEVNGFDALTIDQVSTTEANNWEISKNINKTKKGIATFKLKAESINSFSYK